MLRKARITPHLIVDSLWIARGDRLGFSAWNQALAFPQPYAFDFDGNPIR
jgi:hypothetical protein